MAEEGATLFGRIGAKLREKYIVIQAQRTAQAEERRKQQDQEECDRQRREKRAAEIDAKIEHRMQGRFPISSKEVQDFFREGDRLSLNFREDADIWEKLFAKYPAVPATERERKASEIAFWQDSVAMFYVRIPGQEPELRIKQEILDYYELNEKWLLREYFLATGSVVDTYFGRELNTIVNEWTKRNTTLENFKKQTAKDRTLNRASAGTSHALHERYHEATRQLGAYRDLKKGHMERWGTWYFSNIERTHDELLRPTDPRDFRASGEL